MSYFLTCVEKKTKKEAMKKAAVNLVRITAVRGLQNPFLLRFYEDVSAMPRLLPKARKIM